MKTKRQKQQQLTTPLRPRGFTLVELLVVMTIIAILAGVAVPAAQQVIGVAQQNRALQHSRQIALGLRMFSMDEDGAFPQGTNGFGEPIVTANDAFRDIINYVDGDERVFAVPRSAWGQSADTKVSTPAEILEPGENHFSYIAGLSNTSKSTWPLIVDGTDGNGTYTDQPGQKGGVWKGVKAVVVRVDGSANIVRLRGAGAARFIPRMDDETLNALDTTYMGPDVELLDPAG